jgi:acyl-CoA thioester hydrolase
MSKAAHRYLVHTMLIPVRWGDMDALGHVNNTVYFRFMEQARIEWLHGLSCVPDERGYGAVIVNAHCTFKRPFTFPDKVEIRTYIASPGRSSFETIQEMYSVNDGLQLYAEGGAKVVWVSPESGKSVPLPEVIRQQFSSCSD